MKLVMSLTPLVSIQSIYTLNAIMQELSLHAVYSCYTYDMEKLRKYFDDNKDTTQKSIADKVGVSAMSLNHLLSGRTKPSLELAWKLEKATKRKVKMKDWL